MHVGQDVSLAPIEVKQRGQKLVDWDCAVDVTMTGEVYTKGSGRSWRSEAAVGHAVAMLRTTKTLRALPILLALPAFAQTKPAPKPAPPEPKPAETKPADTKPADVKPGDAKPAAPEEPRGLKLRTPGASEGYTIVEPLRSKDTHLVDLDGKVVHTWHSEYVPAAWVDVYDDGTLLRGGQKDPEKRVRFHAGGIGGVLEEISWDGKVLWTYELATDAMRMHHDIERLPNGNILVIAWENHTREDAIANGRDEDKVDEKEGFWPDDVLELEPTRPTGAKIVWQWHAWDHLVQDRDPKKPNFAKLADKPGRIDINADHRYETKEETPEEKKKRLDTEAEMKKLGYAGGDLDDDAAKDKRPPPGAPNAPPPPQPGASRAPGDPPPPGGAPPGGGPPPGPPEPTGDFMHTNAVAYWPQENLILLSSPHLCEIFVIDHGTTTAEAAASIGGRRGHGGDLLWRFGNPQNYGMGTEADRHCFYQHDPSFLPSGKDMHVLFFNNGMKRKPKEFSVVEEIALPFNPSKGFLRGANQAFGPSAPVWSYSDPEKFCSQFISGAQRLPNGDTLICEGKAGRVFEVTKEGTIVWEYLNPLGGEVEPTAQGGKAPPHALFRATRIPKDHPALKGRLSG